MGRCIAKKLDGKRCNYSSKQRSKYCGVHKKSRSKSPNEYLGPKAPLGYFPEFPKAPLGWYGERSDRIKNKCESCYNAINLRKTRPGSFQKKHWDTLADLCEDCYNEFEESEIPSDTSPVSIDIILARGKEKNYHNDIMYKGAKFWAKRGRDYSRNF